MAAILRLTDPSSGISVECPDVEKPWVLRDAVRDLVNKIVEEKEVHPLQAMMSDTPFEIVVEENGDEERYNYGE